MTERKRKAYITLPAGALALIKRQKALRRDLIAWHVIAGLYNVSPRAVLKAASKM